jgi:hypothetical protein
MKLEASVKSYHNVTDYDSDRLVGYGTFFYPHIILGLENQRGLDEAEQSVDRKIGFDVGLDVSFKEWRAIVYKNGFIVITFGRHCTKDEKSEKLFDDNISWPDEKLERSKACEILNIIFALSALRFHATTYRALIKLAVEANSGKILDCVAYVSSWRDLPLLETGAVDLEHEEVETKRIEIAVRNAAVLLTDRASEKNKKRKRGKTTLYCDRLLILIQAHTHHDNAEHAQSFILSWIIMEHYIDQLWEELLATEEKEDNRTPRNKVKNRFKKLRNFSFYTTDTKLEVLKLTSKLALEQYDLLMAFKELRNDISHKGRVVTSEQSHNILFVASMLVGKGLDLASAKKVTLEVTDNEGKLVNTWDFPDVPFVRLGIDVGQKES